MIALIFRSRWQLSPKVRRRFFRKLRRRGTTLEVEFGAEVGQHRAATDRRVRAVRCPRPAPEVAPRCVALAVLYEVALQDEHRSSALVCQWAGMTAPGCIRVRTAIAPVASS